jgi:hypothetical protein
MNLAEAKKKVADNQHLIGTIFEGDEISELVLVPANGANLNQIVMSINFGESYGQYLVGYSDFRIDVFLNFDNYPNDGVFFTHPLERVLKTLSEQ